MYHKTKRRQALGTGQRASDTLHFTTVFTTVLLLSLLQALGTGQRASHTLHFITVFTTVLLLSLLQALGMGQRVSDNLHSLDSMDNGSDAR